MIGQSPGFRLGIISSDTGGRDQEGRLVCSHSVGRLGDRLRQVVPGTKLCIPVLNVPHAVMNHRLDFPPEDVVDLPPLKTVMSSQAYFFQTRRIVRRFAGGVDVLLIRVPFQIPLALRGLRTPKLLHVVSNPQDVIAASNDYAGLMKRLALRFAAHTNSTLRRMMAEPRTLAATNGREMWDHLGCHEGRVVVSSCIYEHEMRPRQDFSLGSPPRLLFVGFLRPEKGIHILLDAFEALRRARPLKLTLAGGTDKVTTAEAYASQRIRESPFRDDITLTGMVEFGEPLFELYRSHDLLVLPSLSEGTPRALVEARSLGCPVIASAVGGIPSSVQHEKTGLLVKPGDSRSVAAAIERVLDDQNLRLGLIQRGLDASKEHSLEYFAQQLIEEIQILARDCAGVTNVPVASN